MKPLFMWAGGKTKLLEKYKPHLPESFDSYHEPFFGGGAMFLWAYKKNPHAKFYINDINSDIMKIYEVIRDDPTNFCALMDKFQSDFLFLDPPMIKTVKTVDGKSKTEWLPHPHGSPDKVLEKSFRLEGNTYDWKKIYSRKMTRRTLFFKIRQQYQEDRASWSKTKEAATLYFLMKTAFNGVWQLSKKNGAFNTPCGLMRQTDKIYDKNCVWDWNSALQNCTITSVDFQDTLSNIGSNSFTFLDPPYRSASDAKKTFADYGTELGDYFQKKVIEFFNKARYNGSYTLLSNRDWGDGFFEKRVGENRLEYFDVTYTVGRKKKEGEHHTAKKAREILMIAEQPKQRRK